MRDKGLLISLILGILILWVVSGFVTSYFLQDWGDRGTFGDMFGAVSSLFSGLAFAAIIHANILQKKDLDAQRADLKRTVRAQLQSERDLAEQVDQMKISSKLNALNTIISYYSHQIADPSNSEESDKRFKEKRIEAIKEIDELIDRVSDEEFEDN